MSWLSHSPPLPPPPSLPPPPFSPFPPIQSVVIVRVYFTPFYKHYFHYIDVGKFLEHFAVNNVLTEEEEENLIKFNRKWHKKSKSKKKKWCHPHMDPYGNMSQPKDRFTTDSRPNHDRFTIDSRPIHNRFTTDSRPIHARFTTDLRLIPTATNSTPNIARILSYYSITCNVVFKTL